MIFIVKQNQFDQSTNLVKISVEEGDGVSPKGPRMNL